MSNARELAELGGSYGTGGFVGMKNRIINGGMVIDQRNAGSVVSSSTADDAFYTIDRWYARQNAASKFSIQRSAVAPAGFSNSVLLTSLSAYSLTTSEHFGLTQPIEGFNTADFAWGTASGVSVTLSFWVRSSLTGTFGGHVNNADSTMTYVFSYTISAANTWEYKTITIPAPSTSTWQTGNLVGVYVTLSIGAGSSVARSTGWGSFARSVTGQTSVVGTNGATFYATGVQLEKGSTATSFDYRPYGTELALCMRYFERKTSSSAYGLPTGYVYLGSNDLYFPIPLLVTKRAIPTLTFSNSGSTFWNGIYGTSNTSGTIAAQYSGNPVAATCAPDNILFYQHLSGSSGIAAGCALLASINANQYIDASAEL